MDADTEETTKKVSRSLLHEITSLRLNDITYINLSYLNLVGIEQLNSCPNLEVVLLRGNQIDFVPKLTECRNLWKLDLSNNRIKLINGLSIFSCLGSLGLSNNRLEWRELQKIQHVQIISLTVQGNPGLSADQHYRSHVIDCLPLVWMLDGDIVSADDRRQVEQFFVASASSTQPVRHKFSSHTFVTSAQRHQQKFMVHNQQRHRPPEGIYGKWYDEMTRGTFCKWIDAMSKEFSQNEVHNPVLDLRRVQFAGKILQYLIEAESFGRRDDNLIVSLVADDDIELSFLMVVLLMGSAVFSLSLNVVRDLLFQSSFKEESGYLELFQLPKQSRIELSGLLYSHVKVLKRTMYTSKEFAYEEENLMKVLPHLVRIITFLINVDRDIMISDVWEQSLAVYLVRRVSYLPNCAALLEEGDGSLLAIVELATYGNVLEDIDTMKRDNGFDDMYAEELNKLVGANLRSKLVTVNVKVMKKVKKVYDRSLFNRGRRSAVKSGSSSRAGTLPTQSNSTWDRLHTSYSHLSERKPTTARVQSAPSGGRLTPHPWKDAVGPSIGDFVYLTDQCFGQVRGRPAPNVYLVHVHSWPQRRFHPTQQPSTQASANDFLYLERDELVWRDNRYQVRGDLDLMLKRKVVEDFAVLPHRTGTPHRGRDTTTMEFRSKSVDIFFPQLSSRGAGDAQGCRETFLNRYGTNGSNVDELVTVKVPAPGPVGDPCPTPAKEEVPAAVLVPQEENLVQSNAVETSVISEPETAEEEKADTSIDSARDDVISPVRIAVTTKTARGPSAPTPNTTRGPSVSAPNTARGLSAPTTNTTRGPSASVVADERPQQPIIHEQTAAIKTLLEETFDEDMLSSDTAQQYARDLYEMYKTEGKPTLRLFEVHDRPAAGKVQVNPTKQMGNSWMADGIDLHQRQRQKERNRITSANKPRM